MENFNNENEEDSNTDIDPEDPDFVVEAKREKSDPTEFSYTERDVILYNLGVGATESELQWTYEGHENFAALPSFGVIPQFAAIAQQSFDWLPNFNPVRSIHHFLFTPVLNTFRIGQAPSRRTIPRYQRPNTEQCNIGKQVEVRSQSYWFRSELREQNIIAGSWRFWTKGRLRL